MAEIVNLRLLRKQKYRDAARLHGTQAAAKSGRSKALKALEKACAERAGRDLDGNRRDGRVGSD